MWDTVFNLGTGRVFVVVLVATYLLRETPTNFSFATILRVPEFEDAKSSIIITADDCEGEQQ